MPPRLSVLIPVYNEAATLETMLRGVAASSLGLDTEIVVVDDGSLDETPAVLRRLAHELPFRLITHPKNLGKGAAIHTALAACQGVLCLIQDSDLEYDPDDYPALIKPLAEGRVDVVYGSRFLGPHKALYFWHRLGNWVITMAVNILFNASLTDVETGYKAFRKELVDLPGLRARGFEFEVELTCKLLRRGVAIFEVPVAYYGRSYAEGKKITWKDGIHALWVILCCRLNPRY